MALYKEIELNNGVVVKYHRIVSLNKITNICNIIEVGSYTSENKRDEEKTSLENNLEMNVYIETDYINKEYDEKETIEDAYEYLKNTEKFKDAKDI